MLKRKVSGFDYFGVLVTCLYAAIFGLAYFSPEFSREHLQLQGLTNENPISPKYGPLQTILVLSSSFIILLKAYLPNILLKVIRIAFIVIAIYGLFFVGLVFGSAFVAFGVIVRIYQDNEEILLLQSKDS